MLLTADIPVFAPDPAAAVAMQTWIDRFEQIQADMAGSPPDSSLSYPTNLNAASRTELAWTTQQAGGTIGQQQGLAGDGGRLSRSGVRLEPQIAALVSGIRIAVTRLANMIAVM